MVMGNSPTFARSSLFRHFISILQFRSVGRLKGEVQDRCETNTTCRRFTPIYENSHIKWAF
jgi:hypothetical protein